MEQRYRTKERWLSPDGEFQPNMHYGVGGNTKFWGAVLYRLREEDFEATEHADGVSPAWPIKYEDLAPYYDRAEQLYHVHGQAGVDPTEPPRGDFPYPAIPHTAGMQRAIERLRFRGAPPVAAAARSDSARGVGWLHAVRHLQFIPVPDRREERRRDLRDSARARDVRQLSISKSTPSRLVL